MPKLTLHTCFCGAKVYGWPAFVQHTAESHLTDRLEVEESQMREPFHFACEEVQAGDEVHDDDEGNKSKEQTIGVESSQASIQHDPGKEQQRRLAVLHLKKKTVEAPPRTKLQEECRYCPTMVETDKRFDHFITHLWVFEENPVVKRWSGAIKAMKDLDRYVPVFELFEDWLSPQKAQIQHTPTPLISHILKCLKKQLPKPIVDNNSLHVFDFALFLSTRVIPKVFHVASEDLCRELKKQMEWVAYFFDCRSRKEIGYQGIRLKNVGDNFRLYTAKYCPLDQQYTNQQFNEVWRSPQLEKQKALLINQLKEAITQQVLKTEWGAASINRRLECQYYRLPLPSQQQIDCETIEDIKNNNFLNIVLEDKCSWFNNRKGKWFSIKRPLFFYDATAIFRGVDHDGEYKGTIVDFRTLQQHQTKKFDNSAPQKTKIFAQVLQTSQLALQSFTIKPIKKNKPKPQQPLQPRQVPNPRTRRQLNNNKT